MTHPAGYACAKPLLESGELTIHGWVYDLRGGLSVYDDDAGPFITTT
jgi:hypothetical protein